MLWSIGGSITIAPFGTPITIPGYLVFGVVVYSGVVSGLMLLFGHHLTGVIERMNQSEAEFRAAADAFQGRTPKRAMPTNATPYSSSCMRC